GLERGDRMHRMRAPNGCSICFRQSEESNFPFLHQSGHGANRFLNRGVGIYPMQVIKVDAADAESTQTTLARLADILRLATGSSELWFVRTSQDAELGRHHHTVAMTRERASD